MKARCEDMIYNIVAVTENGSPEAEAKKASADKGEKEAKGGKAAKK